MVVRGSSFLLGQQAKDGKGEASHCCGASTSNQATTVLQGRALYSACCRDRLVNQAGKPTSAWGGRPCSAWLQQLLVNVYLYFLPPLFFFSECIVNFASAFHSYDIRDSPPSPALKFNKEIKEREKKIVRIHPLHYLLEFSCATVRRFSINFFFIE